jgi:uncharacterized protein (TIGR03067 family)
MRINPVSALVLFVSLAVGAVRIVAQSSPIEGTWLPVSAELAGKPFPEEVLKTTKLVVKGDKFVVTVGDSPDSGQLKINNTAKPKTVDIVGTEGPNKGKTFLAIFERDGDTMRMCYDLGGVARPKEFKTAENTQLFLVTYKLQKP